MLRTNSFAQRVTYGISKKTYGVKESQLRDRYHNTRSSFSIGFFFNLYLYELESRWQHTGTFKENAEMNDVYHGGGGGWRWWLMSCTCRCCSSLQMATRMKWKCAEDWLNVWSWLVWDMSGNQLSANDAEQAGVLQVDIISHATEEIFMQDSLLSIPTTENTEKKLKATQPSVDVDLCYPYSLHTKLPYSCLYTISCVDIFVGEKGDKLIL